MSRDIPKFTVLGTGNAGHAFAADISLRGFSVNMADLPAFEANLEAIREKGGIEISGEAGEGFARLNEVTTDLEAAIKGVEIIIVGAPAYAHEPYTKALAPFFEDDQFVLFISCFGALRFRYWMEQLGVKADVTPVEALSLPYATRSWRPGTVHVYAVKSWLPVAAIPAGRTEEFLRRISPLFPQWTMAEDALFTSLNNSNPGLHPEMMLLNTGRIESTLGQGWNLYRDGATESVVKVMEAVEEERRALLKILGVTPISILEADSRHYGHLGYEWETLSDFLRTSPIHANPEIPSTPPSMHTRYLTEDVPFALVPWSSMAHAWGVSVPTVDAMIQLASVIEGVNFFEEGVLVEDLGIDGLSPEQVRELVH